MYLALCVCVCVLNGFPSAVPGKFKMRTVLLIRLNRVRNRSICSGGKILFFFSYFGKNGRYYEIELGVVAEIS